MTQHPRVVGLDLSLTSTGVSDGHTTFVVPTAPGLMTEARLNHILKTVTRFVLGPLGESDEADLVVIEDGAFSRGAQSSGAEILSALRYMVRTKLWHMDVPFAMVPPTTLKKYTTGDGRASKQDMLHTVHARHAPHSDVLTGVKVSHGLYDMADALALAAMGYARISHPLTTQGTEPYRPSLDAVTWPDVPAWD